MSCLKQGKNYKLIVNLKKVKKSNQIFKFYKIKKIFKRPINWLRCYCRPKKKISIHSDSHTSWALKKDHNL